MCLQKSVTSNADFALPVSRRGLVKEATRYGHIQPFLASFHCLGMMVVMRGSIKNVLWTR